MSYFNLVPGFVNFTCVCAKFDRIYYCTLLYTHSYDWQWLCEMKLNSKRHVLLYTSMGNSNYSGL